MKTKGTIFYTLTGIMIIILVLVIAIHITRSTYTQEKPEQIQRERFIDAIKGVKTELQTASRYAEYPALWKAGRNMSATGVNVYLELPNGRERMKEDLIKDYTLNLNSYLKTISTTQTKGYITLANNGIPVTMTEIQEEDVSVNETKEGLTFTIKTHMNSSGKDYRYENDETITSEVPTRLFDMFDRAKAFHEKYQGDASWAMTVALYTRAYINAYNPGYNGSYLREGHTAYDPLQQLLYGNATALKGFSITNIDDLGSIPLSTWLSEWKYLSEPSFLPPSFDFAKNLGGNAKILVYMERNYDIKSATNCTTAECNEMNDAVAIKAKAADLTAKMKKLQDISDKIKAFKPDEDMDCDEFKKQAIDIINLIEANLDFKTPITSIIQPAEDNAKNTNLSKDIQTNYDTVSKLKTYAANLNNSKKRTEKLNNSACTLPKEMDCKCVDGPEDCEDEDYCKECDDPSCNKIRCPKAKTGDYECSRDETGKKRYEEVECELETCDEDGCETKEYNTSVKIPQCNCGCHPSEDMIEDVTDNLEGINKYLSDNIGTLQRQIDELNKRAATVEKADEELRGIRDLEERDNSDGFDVSSEINYDIVQYKPVTSKCYYNTTYTVKDNGTCGNWAESGGLYAAQVSAAVVCCSITAACCPTVQYASEWFPAIYEISATYTIDEKITDDRNRIIPINLFSNDTNIYGLNDTPKLYTHAAAEFIIYQNHTVTVKPKTADTILVYLYLKKIGTNPIQKVSDSFTDKSCTGEIC